MINPLFSNDQQDDEKPRQEPGYVFRQRHARTIQPLTKGLIPAAPPATTGIPGSSSAVELIRRKVEALYAEEPDVRQEMTEAAQPMRRASKHQQFMHALSTSGKSLAQIQTEWHNYYVQLPTDEKHDVWREFYETNNRQPSAYTNYVQQYTQTPQPMALPRMPGMQPTQTHIGKVVIAEHATHPPVMPKNSKRAVAHIKKQIVRRVISNNEAQLKAKQHLRSLAFGLTTGFIVLGIFLFSFFNEMVIAPFIQPSRHVSATPIIVSSDSIAPSATPEVIIPKINVQIPVVYDQTSINEADVQRALEQGVIHYPTTVRPGQQGNAAFFGHSSNNIFNKGKYKFAFVLLHELVPGDIFYLTHEAKIYTYRVFDKEVVPPTQVSVLNPIPGKTATAALITCDPPGTSTNRLVVWGEQISPDPAAAAVPATPPVTNTDTTPSELPSDGPTMWNRFWNWLF